MRAGWKAARWLDAKGKPFDVLGALAAAANAGVLDCPIPVFTGTSLDRAQKSAAPGAAPRGLPQTRRCRRNIASQGVASAAQREGSAISAGTLAAAEWIILVTSLKAETWSSAEIGDLYRARHAGRMLSA